MVIESGASERRPLPGGWQGPVAAHYGSTELPSYHRVSLAYALDPYADVPLNLG